MASASTDRRTSINAIKNGKGIKHIIVAASEVLGNPILVHDMDYNIIAMSENPVKDDPIWNEYAETGTACPETLEFFRTECFNEEAANAKKMTFLHSDKLKYERIFGKLFTRNNIQIGCSVIIACRKPFQDDCPELFETVCDLMTKEASASEFYRKYGQAYQETFIGKLINGEIADRHLYAAHVESIYIGLKSKIYIALVTGRDGFDPEATRNQLLRAHPKFKYSVYGDYAVILISTDGSGLDDKELLAPLIRLIKKNNLYLGISEHFESLFELPTYFRQAETALREGRNSSADGHVFVF